MHFAGKTKPAAIRGRRDGRLPDGITRTSAVILPSSPLRCTRRPYPTEICDGRWWQPMAPGGGVRGFGDGGPAQYVPHLWSIPIRPPPKLIQRATSQASLFFCPFRLTCDLVLFFIFISLISVLISQ